MRTFVTGMVFMAVLAAAVFKIIAFGEAYLPDLAMAPVLQEQVGPHVLAPYEPSPPAIVSEMVNLAELTKDDVVYDLGSGDGRVVIAAARASGASCVGIEMDRALVEQSRRSAAKEKVASLVRFVEQDIADADLGKASVVMLFLSREANAALRPRLLKELKPGARVVSHCHDMGEWQPDRTSVIENHRVYAWIVPADISGGWTFEVPGRSGERARLEILQQYQQITASVHIGPKTIAVSDLRLRGNELAFTVETGMASLAGPARFTGAVKGGVMQGAFQSEARAGEWKAVRIR